jgi:hypothetical protein
VKVSEPADDAAFVAAATLASKREIACGSLVLSRACAAAESVGASKACGSNLNVVCETMSAGRTG